MNRSSALGLVLILGLVLLLSTALPAEDFRSKPLSERTAEIDGVEYVEGEVLVKFRKDITDHQMVDFHGELGTEVVSVHRGGVRKLRVPDGANERDLVSRLQSDPRVEYAELNTVCHAHMTPNDTYYSYQWHFPNINMPQAWDISTGEGVIVAILDSGIAYENYTVPSYERGTVQSGVTQYQVAPELNGTSFTGGYDFINSDSHPNDNNAHGTHVSGTIAQVTNNSQGTAGIAFDCTLMPVKVLDYSGSGTAQSLADGLYWAADHGAQVVNMSLGWSPGYNPGSTVANAVAYAYNQGVVLLASSGNSGGSPVSYPAAYSQVISVGATRYDNARASYSQYGSELEICAPGGDISVDQNGDGYGDGVLQMTFTGYDPGPPAQLADPTDFGYWFYEGTSMACPHAVGLVALMIANGQTGVENIRNILHETCLDLGSAGWDQYYGYGRIDAYAALTYGGEPPVAEFSGSPTSGCDPLTVSFTDQSTGDVTSWDWDFGDGGNSSAQNPDHQYTDGGYYTVSLTVTGPEGSDTETKTNYIHVQEAPTAAFSGSPTSGCAPLTVSFTDQSTGDVTSWDWDFGDGGNSSAQNPNHQYTDAGDYTVTLTVTGPCGSDAETKTDYISVGETLIADFSGTPTSGCAPLTVDFTDASTGDITGWGWDFGDGGNSSAQNPSHQYASAGDYTVTLTVTGSSGSDGETKTNYIHVDGPPVAGFYGDPTSGDAPLVVDFYDQSTGQVTFWDWDFGDGGTSTAQNATYQYTDPGDYTVSLTVSGPCGSDAETKTGYIHVDTPSEWTVITYDDFEGGFGNYTDGGNDCYLYTGGSYAHQGSNAADIQDNSGTSSSFYHTYGYDVTDYTELEVEFWFYAVSMDNSNEDFWVQYYDGSTWHTIAAYARGTDFNNNVFYNKVVSISSSQYDFPANAKLRFMCDASGNSDDVYIDEIEFRGKAGAPVPPVAAFVGNPTSGYAPLTVDFTDQSTGNPTGWSWTFGDGGTSSLQNPSHEYTEAGTYTVSLTVTNSVGSDDEVKTNYITVTIEAPVAAFVGNPTSGVVPLTVTFADQSTGPIDTWAWDFGDGIGTSSAQNPVYEYTEIGTYTVSLTVTGPGGSDTETKVDYIDVTETSVDEMHVQNIEVSRRAFWWFSYGIATVTIYDQGGSPVPSATVYGSFSGPLSQNVSGSTNSSGQITFNSSWSTASGEWCFEVTDVVKTGWTYNSSANLVTKACESGWIYGLDEVLLMQSAPGLPEAYDLLENYPDPFSLSTAISFELPQPSAVRLEVYSITGRRVATLVDGVYPGGRHTVSWNASGVASGVYFYRMTAGDKVITKKMILTR